MVFQHLQDQADQQKLEILISKPLDLFQINISYLHTYKTLTLIQHVPIVAEENKLNLLQFIPFPLSQSLGANTTLTPKVEEDLIAVGKNHQYKLLGHTDLIGCTKLGQNFLCKGKSVLRTNIEDSFRGALYLHNLPVVLKYCQFQLGETKETVFQTGPTQWLVSAPKNLHQSYNVKNHMKLSSSTRSPPSRSNLDANCSSNCTSFNLTQINNCHSKLGIMHGTGTSNFSFLRQISP